MSSSAATTDRPLQRAASTPLRLLQVFSVLTLVSLLFQFVTAGQLFPDGGPEMVHASGAYAAHAVSLGAAIAAIWMWRHKSASFAIAALAVVTFGGTLVQAAVGGRSSLWIHVPGAMILTTVAVWLTAWSFSRGARSGAQQR